MKQRKNLARIQKKILDKRKLNPKNWLIRTSWLKEMVIMNKESGKVKKIGVC